MNTNELLYPIGEIASLTGVNPITLRAWERRYGLIDPIRTEGGHRLYNSEHLALIKQAVNLTQQGMPISQVKSHLSKIAIKSATDLVNPNEEHKTLLIKAVRSYDLELLSLTLDNTFIDLSDKLLLSLVWQITQELAGLEETSEVSYLALWSAQLLPRLYTRLQFIQRNQNLNLIKRVWLQAEATPLPAGELLNQIGCVIAAIKLAEQNIYSLISLVAATQEKQLTEQIKLSKCHGLALFNAQGKSIPTKWNSWIKSYPSLELHYIWGLDSKDISESLTSNSEYYQHFII